ncbi:E3 ubiquitin-protein ligase RFWD3-like isoform X2 [Dreissena polymorpha]|uniref:E3 ubiquitin-protein ligase RFWD3-like isoform X2 n=1 Tax=Dreissena polymorpha TaxID=45954 RepID=UPI00226411D4|nr:E3 ubiquitin-protein ligase RFWD3-like isoform X2 [Dreissena polymorpha]
MDEDEDFVPPSPIAGSSQDIGRRLGMNTSAVFSQSVGTFGSQVGGPLTSTQIHGGFRNLPPLPRLPALDIDVEVDVEIHSDRNIGSSQLQVSQQRLEGWIVSGRPVVQVQPLVHPGFYIQPHGIQDDGHMVVIDEDSRGSATSGDATDTRRSAESGGSSEVITVGDDETDVENVVESEIEIEDENSNQQMPDIGNAVMEVIVTDDIEPERAVNPAPQEDQVDPRGDLPLGEATDAPLALPSTPGQQVAISRPAVALIPGPEASPADFRTPKRRRVATPEYSARKDGGDDDDGDSCPICFESWTTSGAHRLSSLKCGHLFGQSCIEKWLRGQGGKCPQCNDKAKRQDIRVLYAKSIKALDTSERDRALKELEKEREVRRKAEMEGAQLRLQFQTVTQEANKLRLELERLKNQIRQNIGTGSLSDSSMPEARPSSLNPVHGQFVPDKTIKIWDAGQCRVMAYCPSMATLVVSQPSSSPLFPGFGVKKISTLDFKTSQYLTIHSKTIRDVAFHPAVEDGILLSCGLDKKVKMTSLLSNAVVQSYDTPMPGWSCTWNIQDRNYFYVGLQNGLVLEYDVRNTEAHVREMNAEGSRSPVVSLKFMPSDVNADFRQGGLLIGQLEKVSFFEWLPNQQQRLHMLPLEGSLTSLYVEECTRHIVASYRPTSKHPTVRHILGEMVCQNISASPTVIDNVCTCQTVHTFHGGRTHTLLSRSIVMQHPGDRQRLLVCAGDETSNSVHVWDSATGQLTQRLMTGGVTVDLCTFNINNTTYLAALNDKVCKIYKWT